MGKRLEATHEDTVKARGDRAKVSIPGAGGKALTQRDQMRHFIEKVGEPVTVAEIMEALTIDLDETAIVCAQLKMMTTRVKEKLSRIVINNKWAYYITSTPAKKPDFLNSQEYHDAVIAFCDMSGDVSTPFEALKQLIRENVGNINKEP